MNRAIRAVRDHYRNRGESGWENSPAKEHTTSKCCPMLGSWSLLPDWIQAKRAMCAAAHVRPDAVSFGEWNDDPSRTFAEVLAVVEAADLALNGATP